MPLVSEESASEPVRAVLEDAKSFYEMKRAPGVLRLLAGDPKRLEASWERAKAIFDDGALDRRTKALVAVAVSMAVHSPYAMDFHLREARRLGAEEEAIWEVLRVAEHFTILNRLANGLALDNDCPPGTSPG